MIICKKFSTGWISSAERSLKSPNHYRHGISTARLNFAETHLAVYEGIRNRDPKQACAAGEKHMQTTYRKLMGIDPSEILR